MLKSLKRKKRANVKKSLEKRSKGLKTFAFTVLVFSWGGVVSTIYFLNKTNFFAASFAAKDTKKTKAQKDAAKSLFPWASDYSHGHDLVEPVIQEDRGLAAAIEERDIKVSIGKRYVEFQDIEAVAKTGVGNHSKILISIAFELDSYPAEQELLKKEAKIRELVTLVLSDKDRDDLQKPMGFNVVKDELLKRLKLIMSNGMVTDILITSQAYR